MCGEGARLRAVRRDGPFIEADRAARKGSQGRLELIDRRYAHRVQVITQDRLDGALPARIDLERLREPRRAVGRRQGREPGSGAGILLAQRGLLQRVE